MKKKNYLSSSSYLLGVSICGLVPDGDDFNFLIPYVGKKFSVLLIGRLENPGMVLNK